MGVTSLEVDLVSDIGGRRYIIMRDSEEMTMCTDAFVIISGGSGVFLLVFALSPSAEHASHRVTG